METGPKINENTELEIFGENHLTKPVKRPEAAGLKHLALRAENIEDVIKELNAKGIEVEPVRVDEFSGKKMTFFQDPDGLPLELHE